MHASDVTPEVVERVRQLYWHSDESVNKIADVLDLSKGALYGAIPHLLCGLGCPLCGDQVGYPNRTAREQEHLACLICEWDGSPDETVSYTSPTDDSDTLRERAKHPRFTAPQTAPGLEGDDGSIGVPARPPLITPRLSSIATGAVVGAALGLVVVLWGRRR